MTFLRDAGIRVELKPFLVVVEEETCVLRGRFSEPKDVAKDMNEYARTSLLRWEFEGEIAESEIREKYLKKSVKHYNC